MPYLEKTLAENAVIDLCRGRMRARTSRRRSPISSGAPTAGASTPSPDLRLVGIEFDAKTLRVVAEADGSVREEVTRFPANAFSAR